MKRSLAILTLAGLSLTAVAVRAAAPAAPAPVIIKADAVKWSPGTGALKGAQIAVLYGDPNKAGSQYAMRLKLPDGTAIGPHTHANMEQVTVISGTFLVGVGKKVDAAKMIALPAGSFVEVPAGLPHYARAQGETVLEGHGVGKFTMDPVK
jgi:quercetin dioxygenase-like cupin family protein